MRGDDDDGGAAGAEPRGLIGDRSVERCDRQADRVARDRRLQRAARRDADDADIDASGARRAPTAARSASDRRAGLDVDQVRGEERELRLGGARLQCAARIVGRRALASRDGPTGPKSNSWLPIAAAV